MKKVVIVDSYSSGSFHEMFNACYLLIFDQIFDDIKYLVSEGQKHSILELIKSNKKVLLHDIHFEKCFVVKDSGKYTFLLKCVISAFLNCIIFFRYRRSRTLVYNINNPLFTIILCRLISLFPAKIIIVNHGELEYLRYEENEVGEKFTRLSRIWGKFLKKSFYLFRGQKGVKFVVLSVAIKNNLLAHFDVSPEQVIAIDHPYLFDEAKKAPTINQLRLDIGTIGGVNRIKGGLYLGELLTKMSLCDKLNWHIIGKCSVDLPVLENLNFYAQNQSSLSREKFDILVGKLHIALFFYPRGYYKLMASGAIFDAINHGIPIIALRNDYFNYLFDKYGDFGILCDTIEQMENAIYDILFHQEKLCAYYSVIERVKRAHSVENVGRQLNLSLESFF